MRDGTVLLVDPDRDTRIILRTVLEAEGYTVREAEDCARALRLARYDPPALIIGDFPLEGMDGAPFMETVRSDPRLRRTRLVAFTAHAMPEHLDPLRKQTDAVFTKPLEPRRLAAEVGKIIGGRRKPPRPDAPLTA